MKTATRIDSKKILELPMAHTPGEAWSYSTADTQLVSAIFTRLVGRTMADYAAEKLFRPLGIREYEWPSDAGGDSIGGAMLQWTTRDMARFGYLYLNKGFWEDRQLVPVEWVDLTTTPQGNGYYAKLDEVTPIEWYGYLWWTWKPEWFSGHRVIAAEGYGGQWIVIVPDIDVVFIVTADSYVTETQSEEQKKEIYDVINSYVLPAVTDGTKDSL